MLGMIGGNFQSPSLISPAVLEGPVPTLKLIEDDQSADEKLWELDVQGKTLLLSTRNDADSSGVAALTVVRGTGTAITSTALNASTSVLMTVGGSTIGTWSATGLALNSLALSGITTLGMSGTLTLGTSQAINGTTSVIQQVGGSAIGTWSATGLAMNSLAISGATAISGSRINATATAGDTGTAGIVNVAATTASTAAPLLRVQQSAAVANGFMFNIDNQSTGNLGLFNVDGSGAVSTTAGLTLSPAGNLAVLKYYLSSVGNALTAVGTTRADALQLAAQVNNVTTAAAGTGVILPVGVVGMRITVFNAGANPVQVYASASETVDGVAGATGVPLTNAKRADFFFTAANTWISAQLGVVSA